MNKIRILAVNNIDLAGRNFNGYDMIKDLNQDLFDVKQATIIKRSRNKKVIEILPKEKFTNEYYRLIGLENDLSISNVLSITTPALMDLNEYKEADIIHFHMFHNSKISLYSILKISQEKKIIISLHDPWFLTGRCVHFYDCNKWKDGCIDCPNLETLFPFIEDNCGMMWNLKKKIFENINIDIVVSSQWMFNLLNKSPILKYQKNIHFIPFGVDVKKLNSISKEKARRHYKIHDDETVLFLRSQSEFKGVEYVIEAMKLLNINKKITVIACDQLGLLDELRFKYKIIDLGYIDYKEMIRAMNACDIFLMPSKGESFGMMAIEAMACKKPVIIFDNTAMPSVTKSPECGYLVKDKDARSLAKAIEHLVQDERERNKRGFLGYKIAKSEYALDKYNLSLEELFKSVYYSKNANKSKLKKPLINKSEEKALMKFLKSTDNNQIIEDYKNINFSDFGVNEYICQHFENRYRQIKNNGVKSTYKYIIKKELEKHPQIFTYLKKRQHKIQKRKKKNESKS